MPQKKRFVYEDFRAIRKGEPGYSPTRRQMISPSTGEIIPRSQFVKQAKVEYYEYTPKRKEKTKYVEEPDRYEGLRGRKEPTHYISRTIERIEHRNQLSYYNMRVDQFVRYHNHLLQQQGIETPLTRGQAMRDPEFKQLYQDLKSKDNSPSGKKAKALVDLGLRDESADYDVGDTP